MSKVKVKSAHSKIRNSVSPVPEDDFPIGQGLLIENSSTYSLCIVKNSCKGSSHPIPVTLLKEAGSELEYSIDKDSKISSFQVILRLPITKKGRTFKITSKELHQIEKYFKSPAPSEPLKAGKRRNPENKSKTKKNTKRKKTPSKYKKGVFNPAVSVIDTDPVQDDSSPEPIIGESVRINNLNFYRAAKLGNLRLLQKLLKSKQKISNILQKWGPEWQKTCLEIAILNENPDIVTEIIKELQNPSMKKTFEPISALSYVGTGSVSIEAYGVRTRTVQMSRGGREGNNALLCEMSWPDSLSILHNHEFLRSLIRQSISPKMINLLISLFPMIESSFYMCIGEAVRTGNVELRKFLLKKPVEKNSFGFNFLHEQVLSSEDLAQFKKVSVTKKPIDNYLIAPLHVACINPDTRHLVTLLSNIDDINYPDIENRKIVHYAAACTSAEPLRYLETLNINFAETDRQKITPLMIAASLNRVDNVEFLLSKNVPINFKSRSGKCAIHFAAEFGHSEVIKVLLNNGATIDFPGSDRKTPLMFASINGMVETVDLLIKQGAKNTKRDKCRRTALVWAVKNGHSKVVSLLLSKGCPPDDPDSSKNYPVHYAAAYGWLTCLQLLVSAGADINVYNDWKLQPLLVAMLKGQTACVNFLLSQENIEVNGKDENGRTLVSQAIEMLTDDALKQVKFLLEEKKADCNVPDVKGFTPLHHLCNRGKPVCTNSEWTNLEIEDWIDRTWHLQLEAAKLLIKNGCNMDTLSKEGLPAIIYAMRCNNTLLVDGLINSGASLNFFSPISGGVFHSVCTYNPDLFPVLNTLLDNEALCKQSLNTIDELGVSPILKFVNSFAIQVLLREEQVRKHQEKLMSKEIETKKSKKIATQVPLQEDDNFSQSSLSINQTQGFNNFLSNNLSLQIDYKQLEANAKKQASEEISEFSKLLKKMVKKGADPSATVQKLLKYRENPELIQTESGLPENSLFVERKKQENFILDYNGNKRFKEYSPEGQQNLLHMVAGSSSWEVVSFLINLKINFNQRDFWGDTPLMLFVKNESKFTQELIKKGADVNIRNCNNELPLQKAIENKSLSSVKLLLEAKALTDVHVDKGKTLLNIAVEKKDLEILQALLESKANPNFPDVKLRTSLHIAFNASDCSANASFDIESLLLQFNADINAIDCRGRCPLHYSFVKIGKHEEILQIDPIESVSSACALSNIQLNIQDHWKKTPLHYAAQRGALTSTMFMLNKGADLEIEDEEGNTSLAVAIKEGHANYAVMLVQQKANVHKRITVQKKKTKEQLKATIQKINPRIMKFVIDHPDTEASSRLAEGEYSMFRAAVVEGFQGLAYLLIFNGYPYMLAMQDAMTHNKFQLVKTLLAKVSDNWQLQQVNEKGQNLFHTLAIFGANADQIITRSVCKQLKDRGVKLDALDKENRSPLHYACQSEYLELIRILLENGVSHLKEDVFGIRPVAYAMQDKKILSCVKTLELFISFGANLNVKIRDGLVELPPLLHAIKQKAPIHIIKYLMDNGSSITEKDSLGRTALIYAIMNNDIDLTSALMNEKKLKIKETDKEGRNCLHYVVQPLQYGSYENKEILKLLLSSKEISGDHPDCRGKTAFSLALEQRSGRLAEVFQSFGLKLPSKAGAKPRPENEKWSDFEPDDKKFDFTADAAEYVRRQKDLQKTEEIPRRPDPVGEFPNYYQVVQNYDLLMTKVDLSHGPYSAYVFYRMQLLEDTNRNVFVVFTRWGRIGETGAHQRTPFADFNEAVKEFCKIFKNKSGNDWEEMFEKKKGKYVPMKLNFHQTKFNDFIQDFDEKINPPCRLAKETELILKLCTSQTMYRSLFSRYSVDINILNFSSISKETLEKAEEILLEISLKSKEMMKETDTNLKIEIIQDIQELSSRYYELIPVIHEHNSAIPPIISDRDILQNIEKINLLKNMELASKLILAALNVQAKINPYDYISSCLHTNLNPLVKESPEFEMISTYVSKSGEKHQVLTVHKLCRKGEPKRIQKFSNEKHRKLLWHGTSAANILGILTQGLKIAPPEVPNTGYMFGKGIYFADCFSKSFGYCFDGFDNSKSAFLLLCEVVLGNVLPKKHAEFIEKLDKEYLATLGLGKNTPDPKGSIFTPYGVEVPLGELIDSEDMSLTLNYNEYIVYDTAQVRMRYLVQIKTD